MEPINPRHIQDLGLAEGQPAERRRRIEHDDSTPLPYLDIGIITKILERLPVKSLLRFRSVCKSWRFLISSPKFVKTHMGLSAKNNEFHHLMLSAEMPGDFEIKCCPLYSAPYADAIELHHSFGNLWPRSTFSIVGSWNGLVCVTIDLDELYLWNPCTRECKKLPNLDVELVYILDDRYGLGYDDFSEDFKVVGLFTGFIDLVYKVWVYSVKAGSWRRIQDFPCAEIEGNDGVYANGALHWVAKRHRTPRVRYPSHIISLDLRDETFREVALPTYGDGKFTFSVGALGGSLIVRCACGSRVDLWLMKPTAEGSPEPDQMGGVKLIVSDFIMSFMWVWSSVLIKTFVYKGLGLGYEAKGEVFKSLLSIINMFFFAWLGKVTKGGAYNPLTVLSGAISGDFKSFLFTVGARIPAQVIGSVTGVRLILETFPEIGRGPSLNVDIHKGALTEGFLTFTIVLISLGLAAKIPGNFLMKTWISSVSKLSLHILGSDLTGGCMNPASVMGWAYARGDHITKEHIFVYWLAPIEATLLAVWIFKLLVQPLKEEKAKVKAEKSD